MAPSNRGLVRLVLSQETRVRIPLELPGLFKLFPSPKESCVDNKTRIIREGAIRESASVIKSHAKKTLAPAGASRYNLRVISKVAPTGLFCRVSKSGDCDGLKNR